MRDSSSVVFSFNLILFFEIVNQIKKMASKNIPIYVHSLPIAICLL